MNSSKLKEIEFVAILFLGTLMATITSCDNNFIEKHNYERELERSFQEEEFNRALEITSHLLALDSLDHVAMANRAEALYNLGRFEEGFKTINEAIRIEPYYSQSYSTRAWLKIKLENYTLSDVIDDIDIALSEAPGNSYLQNLKLTLYNDSADYTNLILGAEEAIRIDPKNPSLVVWLGCGYRKQKRYQEAMIAYNRAIEIDPNFGYTYNEISFWHLDQEEFDEALNVLNLLISPENNTDLFLYPPLTYENRGFINYKLNKLDEALIDVNHSLELDPGFIFAYKTRSLIYLAMDSIDLACADLHRARPASYDEKYSHQVDSLLKVHCN